MIRKKSRNNRLPQKMLAFLENLQGFGRHRSNGASSHLYGQILPVRLCAIPRDLLVGSAQLLLRNQF